MIKRIWNCIIVYNRVQTEKIFHKEMFLIKNDFLQNFQI